MVAPTASDGRSRDSGWYRHRWPWLLMAGPAAVVVAGAFTAWLAVKSDDGLVAEDYYKRGLLINRQLEKAQRSTGIGAVAELAADGALRVQLAGAAAIPDELRLRFAHATRSGLDRSAVLTPAGGGLYAGRAEPLPAGRWLITLEAQAWRLPTVEVATPVREIRLGTARGPARAGIGNEGGTP